MDRLWSPWRYNYVSSGIAPGVCIFCAKLAESDDRKNWIVARERHNFVLLNLYPYTNGHLMIAPYAHIPTLDEATTEARAELIELSAKAERALRKIYRPGGINLGMNLGECAGAGVAGHIHMHVLPRWPGDASFMTTVGETRVMPEDLSSSYDKLLAEWRA